jgi:hypothetical protein
MGSRQYCVERTNERRGDRSRKRWVQVARKREPYRRWVLMSEIGKAEPRGDVENMTFADGW